MIIDISAESVLEELRVACDEEVVSVDRLLTSLRNGERDKAILEADVDGLVSAHNKKMGLFSRLESLRIDK